MIPIQGTVNPEVIEGELARLWQRTARAELRDVKAGDERATLRARVANLMVYGSSDSSLKEINEVLQELSGRHPCRALVMIGTKESADRDIEISVASFCHPGGEKTRRQLCCEEVNLKASGRFVEELPSAATPLLVPDLPVFLWWREGLQTEPEVFAALARRADRVIIDSADLENAGSEMSALQSFITAKDDDDAAFSDMNWARLTSWRALLAGMFDTNPTALDHIVSVRIEYAATGTGSAVSAQPLLFAGWLAGRLNWKLIDAAKAHKGNSQTVKFEKDARQLTLEFIALDGTKLLPGRLAHVELATADSMTFEVERSQDGLYLETRVNEQEQANRRRILQSHTRALHDLLGGEMDILCRDQMWEDAVHRAAAIVGE
jgi:glucose-6-phosphate dehydrogenase assembly protein OpcA